MKMVELENGEMGTVAARIQEINDRIDWMNENLEGCDWCCGGGDEEMRYLCDELEKLSE